MDRVKEKNEPKNSGRGIFRVEIKNLPFVLAVVSGAIALVSGVLLIIENLQILTFDSQSVLSALNSTSALNSSSAAYLGLAFNGISSVKNGIIVLGPLLIIAGIFMVISAFYFKSETLKSKRDFGIFLMFFFSLFAIVGLLIYIPFNSLSVLILVYLPLTVTGSITYALIVTYMVTGMAAGAIALLKEKRYLS